MASSKAGRDESRRDGISARIYDESTFTRSLSIFFSSKKREREGERDELLRDRSLLIMGDVYESYREK